MAPLAVVSVSLLLRPSRLFFTLTLLPAHGDRLIPGCCGSTAVCSWPRCWRRRKTWKSCSSSPGRLHVNAQYYRISQVVSGVCRGRVRREAAGPIGRRDPGGKAAVCRRRVGPLPEGNDLRDGNHHFTDLIQYFLCSQHYKKKKKMINCMVKCGVSCMTEP